MRGLSPLRKLVNFSLRTLLAGLRALWAWLKHRYARMSDRGRKRFFVFLKFGFVFAFALLARPTGMQALGKFLSLSEYKAVWTKTETATLDNDVFPGGRVIDWLNKKLPEDSKFLVYRQAEFAYYVRQNWIYDFDPKIIDLYNTRNKREAYAYLRGQGITHIFIPNYMPATLYNSAVVNLIGDPHYTRELYTHSGMRLLELFETPKNWACEGQPGMENWVQGTIGAQITFEASVKGLFGPSSVNTAPKTFTQFQEFGSLLSRRVSRPFGSTKVINGSFLMVWPNDYRDRVGLLSGYGPIYLAPEQRIDRDKIGAVQMSFEIAGNGFLEIWIYQYNAIGAWSSRRIWDAVLDGNKGKRLVEVQAGLSSDTVAYRILISNGGSAGGHSEVTGLRACGVNYDAPIGPENEVLSNEIPAMAGVETLRIEPIAEPISTVKESPIVKEWDLTPVQSAAALNQAGARVFFGRSCYELAFFCRLLNVQGPSRNLLIRPKDTKGFELHMPIDSGFVIASDKLNTSPRTWWQCKLGRRAWFVERSPAREGLFEQMFLKFVKRQLPSGNNPTDRAAQLHLNVQTSTNTIISASLLWKNEKGHKGCYYLGEKVLESDNVQTIWDFPLPQKYSDLTLAFTTDHPLNDYINLEVASARVVVNSEPKTP